MRVVIFEGNQEQSHSPPQYNWNERLWKAWFSVISNKIACLFVAFLSFTSLVSAVNWSSKFRVVHCYLPDWAAAAAAAAFPAAASTLGATAPPISWLNWREFAALIGVVWPDPAEEPAAAPAEPATEPAATAGFFWSCWWAATAAAPFTETKILSVLMSLRFYWFATKNPQQ